MFSGCKNQRHTSSHLKRHVTRVHFPPYFTIGKTDTDNPHRHSLRYTALMMLRIRGMKGNVPWGDFLGYVNAQLPAPVRDIAIHGFSEPIMRAMCQQFGWPEPEMFQSFPMNSPAVLLNWELLSRVLCLLSPEDRVAWLQECPPPDITPPALAELRAGLERMVVPPPVPTSVVLTQFTVVLPSVLL
jgi:hypothetical protein